MAFRSRSYATKNYYYVLWSALTFVALIRLTVALTSSDEKTVVTTELPQLNDSKDATNNSTKTATKEVYKKWAEEIRKRRQLVAERKNENYHSTALTDSSLETALKKAQQLFSGPRFRHLYNRVLTPTSATPQTPSSTSESGRGNFPASSALGHLPWQINNNGAASPMNLIHGVAQSPDINYPLTNNLERYMPLLNRRGIAANQSITDRLPLIDWEAETTVSGKKNPLGGASGSRHAPCHTPNCRTWITISIPDGVQPAAPSAGISASTLKPNTENVDSTRGNVRGKPSRPDLPEGGNGVTPSPSSLLPEVGGTGQPTTRKYPPDFVFSTAWILPLRRVTIPPPSGSVVGVVSGGGGSGSVLLPTPGPPELISMTTTDPLIENGSSSGSGWGKPFTLKPRPKVGGGSGGGSPPEAKERKPKPWTHSSGSGGSSPDEKKERKDKVSKERPQTPTTSTSIEQAAIWASTELIDAIREALEKFRASLNRNRTISMNPSTMSSEMHEVESSLESTWNEFRKGTWLEKALAELALADPDTLSILPSLNNNNNNNIASSPKYHLVSESEIATDPNVETAQARESTASLTLAKYAAKLGWERLASADSQKKALAWLNSVAEKVAASAAASESSNPTTATLSSSSPATFAQQQTDADALRWHSQKTLIHRGGKVGDWGPIAAPDSILQTSMRVV